MKKMKKLLAAVLAIIMVLSLAACGPEGTTNNGTGSNAKDPITLTWWFGGDSGAKAGEEEVEKAFNELLHTYPGMEHVNIDFMENARKEYKNNITLAQSSGEQIDIVSNYNLGFADQVAIGTYLPIDDYVKKSNGLKDLPNWIWELCKGADGKIYQVPHYQRPASMQYAIIPKVWADKYADLDALQLAIYKRDIDAVADWMVEFLKDVREGEGIDTKYLSPLGYELQTAVSLGTQRDKLTGSFVVQNNSGIVENLYLTEEMVKAYQICADWYDEEYIHPDVLTFNFDDGYRQNMMNPVSYVISFNNGSYDAETTAAQLSESYGFEVVAIPCHEDFYIGHSWAAGGTGVAAKCKYPTEAFRFIELMNSEEGKDLYNMMMYGIEGVHYNLTDDKTVEKLTVSDNQTWSQRGFIIGNTTLGYPLTTATEDENLVIEKIEESDPVNSELSGFVPDLTKIQTQLDQISAVEKEYIATLYKGAMGADWQELYNEFVSKLVTAGLNDVIAELQAQVDAFLAAKKAA